MVTEPPDNDGAPDIPLLTAWLLDQPVVILLQGLNLFGNQIWSYVEMPLRAVEDLKGALIGGESLKPNRFGKVVASGYGRPPDEIRREMEQKQIGFLGLNWPVQPLSPGELEGEESLSSRVFRLQPVDGHLIDIIPDHTQPPPFHDFRISLPGEPEER